MASQISQSAWTAQRLREYAAHDRKCRPTPDELARRRDAKQFPLRVKRGTGIQLDPAGNVAAMKAGIVGRVFSEVR